VTDRLKLTPKPGYTIARDKCAHDILRLTVPGPEGWYQCVDCGATFQVEELER
jgi:hypothetical protein